MLRQVQDNPQSHQQVGVPIDAPSKDVQPQIPKVGSLMAKMKIYNMREADYRAFLRAAMDRGIDTKSRAAFVEYLHAYQLEDAADFTEGIGEAGYQAILNHYGVIKEDPQDPAAAAAPAALPTDAEIMASILDAFEQDVNVCDKKRLIKFLKDAKNEAVAAWLESQETHGFYTLLSQFFGNLGKFRARMPEMMSASTEGLQEDAPAVSPDKALEPAPGSEPKKEPAAAAEPAPPADEPQDEPASAPGDVNTVLMDMYLEGVDVTRRAVLVGELDKAGHEGEAEYLNSLSLSAFYNLLSEFFRGLAKAMGESKDVKEARDVESKYKGRDIKVVRTDKQPSGDRLKNAIYIDGVYQEAGFFSADAAVAYAEKLIDGGDVKTEGSKRNGERKMATTTERTDMDKVAARTWGSMNHHDRVQALIDGGVSQNAANRAAEKDYEELGSDMQSAFMDALASVAESKQAKAKAGAFKKFESPQELLPGEVTEAFEIAERLVKEYGISEAAKTAASRMGKKLKMPEGVVANLEKFLGLVMSECMENGGFSATAAPVSPEKKAEIEKAKKKPEHDDEKPEDPEEKKRKEAEAAKKVAEHCGGDHPEPHAEPEPEKKPEDDEPEKKKEPEDDGGMGESRGDMLRMALGPSKLKLMGATKLESLRAPKAIFIESSTSGGGIGAQGVNGAPGVGMLDVFSYGGYLERALPYLLQATLSRMEEQDKANFLDVYHRFIGTDDMGQLTELAGKLADVVEYGDATQEGTELVKNLRFMGDFLNMMRSSVDFTKKALSL